MTKLYYTPPTDEKFEEVKKVSIGLWSEMGSEPNYSREKIDRIKDIQNVGDNFMYMVAMFDSNNQQRLAEQLSRETRKAIHDRIIDGQGFDRIFSTSDDIETCSHCGGTGEVPVDEDEGEGHLMRGVGSKKCICQVQKE